MNFMKSSFSRMSGTGNSYTTEFRELDTRIGRWWSRDPVFKEWESPYASFATPLADCVCFPPLVRWEIKQGNSYTTEFRELDTRIGRWWSRDPVFKEWESSYAGFATPLAGFACFPPLVRWEIKHMNSYTTEFRELDTRIGRWWSRDPLKSI
jgi:hypothetical protein